MKGFSIGDLARETGCKVPTIRYYEEIGLLPAAVRTTGNQRRYDRAALERLAFVRHARELGFGLDDIRTLLALSDRPDRSCDEADAIARGQLAAVERRLQSLAALKTELERMIAHHCSGRVTDCRVIRVLSDHALCAGTHREGSAQ